MSLAPVEHIDRAAVLRTLNLNPADPHTHALLLICDRYQLDPLMKHVVLIQGRPYVTRDGYLAIAHQSGQFDGIEIVEEGATDDDWWAKAAVYRKDMSRPFVYRGRYPKSGQQKKYGPEMAVKTAEVMALRRAFNVTGVAAADEAWDTVDAPAATPMLPSAAAKGRLLEAAGGDKEAAVAAWAKAGLADRREVSEPELAAALGELDALAWSWHRPDPDADPDAGPAANGRGPGGAADREAADITPAPDSAGQANVDTPPTTAHNGPVRTPEQIGRRSTTVFRDAYDKAPKGHKADAVTRLRHALVYTVTGGRTTTSKDLDPGELSQVWARMDDIQTGRISYVADTVDDKAGVTWRSRSGRETTVMWSDLEPAVAVPAGDGAS